MASVKVLPFILLFEFILVHGQHWSEPYFLDCGTEGVELLEPTAVMQPINVTEEIPWPFGLAIINYDGNTKPFIEDFPNSVFLNASVERKSDKWIIFVNSRQDYEDSNQRVYLFNVVLQDNSILRKHKIRIVLFNIFDNNPSVSYEPIPCKSEV